MEISTIECGHPGTPCYRMYFRNTCGFISPFHDIKLTEDNKVFNMVVEIPRNTTEKMEICRDSLLNPIHQDVTEDGKLRVVETPFPHNYGAFPQTYECPKHKDQHTKLVGDNDPLDVIEIGSKIPTRGQVLQVKVLGIFALIDEEKTDWKVIVIDVTDENAKDLNDIKDLKCKFPDLIDQTTKWFSEYKAPKITKIGLDGEVKGSEFALSIITTTNCYWKKLMKDCAAAEENHISCDNVSVDDSPFKKTQEQLKNELPLACRNK